MSDGNTAWARLEALGHRSHWGLVSEVQVAGASFLQVQTFKLGSDEPLGINMYPPSSIYCLTPCSEEHARMMATPYAERPVSELDAPKPWGGMDVDVDDLEDDYDRANPF